MWQPSRERDSARAGIIQNTLDSDKSYDLADADRALGVRLDGTMTVRVKMLSGTAIAYASVVDVNGDSQFVAAVPSQP